MEINTESIHNVIILRLHGALNSTTAPQVMAFINKQVAEGKVKIVVDLEQVQTTSSAGLRVLLAAVKETRSRAGDIRLAAVQPDVLKVLNLSGFAAILKIFDDRVTAAGSFSPTLPS